jgi:hypothetical protein
VAEAVGTEIRGSVTVGGQKVNVKGDFASDHVTFSGGRRGEVPYARIRVTGTAKGLLRLLVDDAVMEFPVGANVDRLANKIRNPPTLLSKLGVKPGARVDSHGIPKGLAAQLPKPAAGPVELYFLGVADVDGLSAIPDALARVAPGGGLWVVYPKARRDIRESDVLAAGRAAGLKDVKVARVSEKHTALKFMRPAA